MAGTTIGAATELLSLVATKRLSLTEPILEFTNCMPDTRIASALARNKRSAFSSIETSKGSTSWGVTQRPSGTDATGARTVSLGAIRSLALAMDAGLPGRCRYRRSAHITGRGKPPGATDQSPNADPVGLTQADVGNPLLTGADRLVPVPRDTHVHVPGAGRYRLVDGEQCEFPFARIRGRAAPYDGCGGTASECPGARSESHSCDAGNLDEFPPVDLVDRAGEGVVERGGYAATAEHTANIILTHQGSRAGGPPNRRRLCRRSVQIIDLDQRDHP